LVRLTNFTNIWPYQSYLVQGRWEVMGRFKT
jgi:hypothetical protein